MTKKPSQPMPVLAIPKLSDGQLEPLFRRLNLAHTRRIYQEVADLCDVSAEGLFHQSLSAYTRPHVIVIDEIGYLSYGPEAANVLFHVVNDRHLRKRPMIFTTNKPLSEWGTVLHDEDLAAAILDRVLERGRFVHLDGPSGRTRHLKLEEASPAIAQRLRISGINGSEFPEPTLSKSGLKGLLVSHCNETYLP